MDERYARAYRDLYERHWWWRARRRLILGELARIASDRRPRRILDVGSGDALFFDDLSAFGDVEGVEPDATFRPPHRYDLMLRLGVLEHLTTPQEALAHAFDLVEPGGTLLITVPAFRALWTRHDDINHHVTRYTRSTLAPIVTAAGFRVARMRYFFHWLCPAKVAVRVAEALHLSEGKPARVPTRWLNGTLYVASRAEQIVLGSLSVPFGSSLLVIADKPPSRSIPSPS
ncbi:MAG: class I SAM-dependent methyltransferase [Betaproteobacteria bacterium]|nr:MAG: class I SAM-dependent methyltransferase [Betaproteobacteria bacterium]